MTTMDPEKEALAQVAEFERLGFTEKVEVREALLKVINDLAQDLGEVTHSVSQSDDEPRDWEVYGAEPGDDPVITVRARGGRIFTLSGSCPSERTARALVALLALLHQLGSETSGASR